MANPQKTAESFFIIFYLSRPKNREEPIETAYFQHYMRWETENGGCTLLPMSLHQPKRAQFQKKWGL
jgi:hypothetical protein